MADGVSQGTKCYLTNRVPGRNAAEPSLRVVRGIPSLSEHPELLSLLICVCNPSALDYARDSHPMRG